jgi:hypothetical protein
VSQQGLLISVRSGVNARPSRRLISRPTDVDPDRDRAKSATLLALNLISLGITGKDSLGRHVRDPSACNSRAAKILPVAAQPASKPAVRPQTPDIRDDTRKE